MMETGLVHRYLGNGMEVCLSPNDFAPLVSLQVWVKAGSIDEDEGEEGIAHVLEHMLFKGTKHYPASGQIASLVESAGGDINAYTTFDHTVYYLTAPSHFVMEGTRLLLDVVQNSLIDEEELARELEVIIEEIRRMRDNPSAMVSHKLFNVLMKGTKLERPVIGYEEVVKNLTREKVRSFYKRWYSPNNMVFIASGNFNVGELVESLQRLSEDFPPLTVPRRQRTAVGELTKHGPEQSQILVGPYQEARVSLAVRAPSLDDPQSPGFEMMSGVLGGGESSRLTRSVRDEAQLVTNIDSWFYSPRYPAGMYGISFYGMAQDSVAALASALRELLLLSENGPTKEELSRILSSVQASRIYSRESVEGIARALGHSLQSAQKLQFEEHYVEQLKAVTLSDVQRHAREVVTALREGEYALSVALSREQEGAFSADELRRTVQEVLGQSSMKAMTSEHRLRARSSPLNEHVKQIELDLPFGKKLRINYRESTRLPVVSSMLVVRNGLWQEDLEVNGVTSLVAEMLTRGTQRQSYKTFLDELDDNASTIGAFTSKDVFGLRMDSLAEHGLRTLQMTLDCFFRPAFAQDEFTRAKREAIEHIQAQKDSPGARLARLGAPLLFKSHPYAMAHLGTEDSVAKLTVENVRERWLKFLDGDEFVLSFAGTFELDALVDLVHREFEAALSERGESGFGKLKAKVPTPAVQRNEVRFAFDEFEREQAHVSLLFKGVELADGRRTTLEIAANILGGQGGRLFLDLRDKRSLAYSLGASQSPYILGGVFSCYIGTAAHKVTEAVLGLKQHIERLALEPPTQEEMLRAQRSLVGVQSIDAQHHHYQAAQLAMSDIYGLGYDNFLSFEERVNKITASDVQKLMRELIQNSPPILCIVGPKETALTEEIKNLNWSL